MEGYDYTAAKVTGSEAGAAGAGGRRARTRGVIGTSDEGRIGLVPRIGMHLFERMAQRKGGGSEFTVKCSFLQIYNEQIYDLLNSAHLGGASHAEQQSRGLRLRWNKDASFYAEGLQVLGALPPPPCNNTPTA